MRPDTLGVLDNIREASLFIAEDIAGITFELFISDRRIRQLVERNLTIIGEAANRLRRRDPDIADRITALHEIVGMRNALIHGYDVIDYVKLWETVQIYLPVLHREAEQLLHEAESQ